MRCGSRSEARWAAITAWQRGIVFVDGLPVVPRSKKVIALGRDLEKLGEFLDQDAKFGIGAVEEGEEAVDEV